MIENWKKSRIFIFLAHNGAYLEGTRSKIFEFSSFSRRSRYIGAIYPKNKLHNFLQLQYFFLNFWTIVLLRIIMYMKKSQKFIYRLLRMQFYLSFFRLLFLTDKYLLFNQNELHIPQLWYVPKYQVNTYKMYFLIQ